MDRAVTGRVCPVHGEYSATGVCRWCEPETLLDVAEQGRSVLPVSEPPPWAGGRQVPAEEIAAAIRERRFDEPSTYTCICDRCLRGFDAPIPLTSLVCPECTNKDPILKTKAARMKILREVYKLADWRSNLRAPISWRIEYADPARLAATNAAGESRLLAQHAALRWERVARRWNYKHREPDGPDEAGRAYVWRAWLSQVDRVYRASLLGQPP